MVHGCRKFNLVLLYQVERTRKIERKFYTVVIANHIKKKKKKTFLLYLRSEYVKIFDGNGTMVFAVHGWDSASFKNSLQHILFGESKNIMIQVSLTNSRSYVKIDYGILKQRLNSGKNNLGVPYVCLALFIKL